MITILIQLITEQMLWCSDTQHNDTQQNTMFSMFTFLLQLIRSSA
jgi:hypothetical protein